LPAKPRDAQIRLFGTHPSPTAKSLAATHNGGSCAALAVVIGYLIWTAVPRCRSGVWLGYMTVSARASGQGRGAVPL
jgi:hypothetical protein